MSAKLKRWLRTGVVLVVLVVASPVHAFYNPSTGRWLNRDPLADEQFISNYLEGKSALEQRQLKSAALQPNYLFLGNEPITASDSFGLDRWYCATLLHAWVILDKWDDNCCKKIGKMLIEFYPASNFYEALSLFGGSVPGQVAIRPSGVSDFNLFAKTSCAEDRNALSVASALLIAPPNYQILSKPPDFNCFSFALLIYQYR